MKIQLFSGDKQNFQTKGGLSKGIIATRGATKLICDAIVNHPRQSLPHGTRLPSRCYKLTRFCSWHSLMIFLMMVLYLVSCNQQFRQKKKKIKALLSGICVEKSTKIFSGE